MRKIKLNENQLKTLAESIINEYGIDYDKENKTVFFNPNHEQNVNTSVESNPTVNRRLVDGVEVWSIFTRSKDSDMDGNPLIYALKGEKGWHFAEDHFELFECQMNLIIDKYLSEHTTNVTVLMPSGSSLNDYIASLLLERNSEINIINDVLEKLTVDEIKPIIFNDNSPFMKAFGSNEMALRGLNRNFNRMQRERNGMFARHLITDPMVRNAILTTLKVNGAKIAEYSAIINGNDILLIDDSISRGQTINEACEILKNNYSPHSITVLTLLSSLS